MRAAKQPVQWDPRHVQSQQAVPYPVKASRMSSPTNLVPDNWVLNDKLKIYLHILNQKHQIKDPNNYRGSNSELALSDVAFISSAYTLQPIVGRPQLRGDNYVANGRIIGLDFHQQAALPVYQLAFLPVYQVASLPVRQLASFPKYINFYYGYYCNYNQCHHMPLSPKILDRTLISFGLEKYIVPKPFT